jgi:hypothetical protein
MHRNVSPLKKKAGFNDICTVIVVLISEKGSLRKLFFCADRCKKHNVGVKWHQNIHCLPYRKYIAPRLKTPLI